MGATGCRWGWGHGLDSPAAARKLLSYIVSKRRGPARGGWLIHPMEILAPWAGGRVGPVSRKGLGRKPGRKGLGVSGRAVWRGQAGQPWASPHSAAGFFQRWGILGTSWHMPGMREGGKEVLGPRTGRGWWAAPQQASSRCGRGQRGEGGRAHGTVTGGTWPSL